jgi:hypothetical protein
MYVLPDVESIVVAYLKGHDDIAALIPPEQIAAELPPRATFPFLQVSLDGGYIATERHLVGARVGVEAWGGTRIQARYLCATAHAALIDMNGTFTGGVVTGVVTLLAPRKFVDQVNNRPRYQSEVRVYAHP